MEIETYREEDVLVFVLFGRFDTNGAENFDFEMKNYLHPDDKFLVIDLKDVPYLSSGGIRVLISLKKEMKKREGALILSSLQNYPSKVLDMAGLLSFFKTENSRQSAINTAKNDIENFSLIDEIKMPATVRKNVRYTFESGSEKRGNVSVKGNIKKILTSNLNENDIFEEMFDDCYSIGLGSMGCDKKDAMKRLGEMINFHGTMAYYPTDSSNTPDYFTPIKKSEEIFFYSGLNIKSKQLFNDIITMETEKEHSVSLNTLYKDIFSFAYERQKKCKGLIFIVIWGIIDELHGTRIKKSPLSSNIPFGGGVITEPCNFPDWFDVSKEPEFQDETILLAGIIADIKNPEITVYNESVLKSAFYLHPSEEKQSTILSQTHCAVIKNIPWDKNADITKTAKQISENGVITDIRHVLKKTTLKKAKIGISYIENIIPDEN